MLQLRQQIITCKVTLIVMMAGRYNSPNRLGSSLSLSLNLKENKTPQRHAHVIVLGNEKGGSGKSTTAMHIIVALLKMGKRVGAIDLDGRQRSLTRYLENRADWCEKRGVELEFPKSYVIERSKQDAKQFAEEEEKDLFNSVMEELRNFDFVVIDSPGSDTHLSRLGHAIADTLVTPMNDSFVDFDLLAEVNPETLEVMSPSLYAELVWDSRKNRALTDRASIDWVVMRNRVSSLDARNKRRVGEVLESLSPRIGFRIAPGFGERVVFRELFPMGQTLLDLGQGNSEIKMSMSHLAARQEVRELLITLQLPGLTANEVDI